ncbi:hypothetical protein BDN71DRAFT_1435005 [Pleurotus eryngii]|uniref:Secreted protein n=1 Tax=Pleurotus eryngii TaxID=5323 RepID=A0A9P5ZM72_PLEER|nr:hypothetical protein BDN71DRAFT_1435005 [Pleurotus eryngii]
MYTAWRLWVVGCGPWVAVAGWKIHAPDQATTSQDLGMSMWAESKDYPHNLKHQVLKRQAHGSTSQLGRMHIHHQHAYSALESGLVSLRPLLILWNCELDEG